MERATRRIAVVLAFGALVAAVGVSAASASGFTRQIPAAGVTAVGAGVFGGSDVAYPELAGSDAEAGPDAYRGIIAVDRSSSRGGPNGAAAKARRKAKSNPELGVSFDGLNFNQQRFANGGNQFSVEPPDQGMCVGNGFVLESVNDVTRVFHQDGTPATGVTDLNTFYGYPAAINRSTGVIGPIVTDPSCLYDQQTGRWFNVVLTLDVVPSGKYAGKFLGPNHLDIAVSQTSDPTGAWTIYRIPVQDDGTDGTPNHHCSGADTPPPYATNPTACVGDYPHIGADANGFYVTTNEYSLFGTEFHGAQVYAFSKAQLASGAGSVAVTQIDTAGAVNTGSQTQPGFTVWPAQSPGQFESANGGTEYFLSSNAADEATSPGGTSPGPGTSSQLVIWTLTNTSSLNSSPALSLSNRVVPVLPYAIPPKANQKAGSTPLADCLNDPTPHPEIFRAAITCYQAVTGDATHTVSPFHEVEGPLDANDSRMQQVFYANGKLWGALDTALTLNGVNKAGIEYFIVNPHSGGVILNSYLGLAGNNLTHPAIGVTQSGRGVMAFTVVGDDYYPSAGYASIDARIGAGAVQVAQAGAGPQDGFSEYHAFANDPAHPRPRWGDYGAAAVDGNTLWIASEYIGQTCTYEQYKQLPFGRCGGTRGSLGNWDTRISALTP